MVESSSSSFHPQTIFEPFKIKSVEPIRHTTQQERLVAIQEAHYNPFLLQAEDVMIDLLTDSGTGAMSKSQWSSMMLGDESYAGSTSFYKFQNVVKSITGLKHVLPTHQGRAAERILFSSIPLRVGDIVPNNTHFDTTRAHVEYCNAKAIDILIEEGHKPSVLHPFKGNIDLIELEKILSSAVSNTHQHHVPLVMITVTNNSGGGQPVSMANIKSASEICKRYHVPLFLDACRFAENTYFIKLREEGYNDKSPFEIAKEMFSYVDGCTMSTKKDGLSNIGGFLALNDDALAEKAKQALILSEGYITYGGLAGYDMEAIADGLTEVLDEDYLSYRIKSIQYLGEILSHQGIPIVQPTGGHAIYIDAKSFLPHIPQSEFPAWALSIVLYILGGIRSVEIGSVMFGHHPTLKQQPDGSDDDKEKAYYAENELVRLAFPRRVYTQSHLDYLAEVIIYAYRIRDRIRGVVMVEPSPNVLRHFTAHFQPVHNSTDDVDGATLIANGSDDHELFEAGATMDEKEHRLKVVVPTKTSSNNNLRKQCPERILPGD